jgi:SET domain-containing protein
MAFYGELLKTITENLIWIILVRHTSYNINDLYYYGERKIKNNLHNQVLKWSTFKFSWLKPSSSVWISKSKHRSDKI